MWKKGDSVKRIAHLMGCSTYYIYRLACNDRERFPRRLKAHATVDKETKRAWAERVRSGEVNPHDAASACGVTYSSVMRWKKAL